MTLRAGRQIIPAVDSCASGRAFPVLAEEVGMRIERNQPLGKLTAFLASNYSMPMERRYNYSRNPVESQQYFAKG